MLFRRGSAAHDGRFFISQPHWSRPGVLTTSAGRWPRRRFPYETVERARRVKAAEQEYNQDGRRAE